MLFSVLCQAMICKWVKAVQDGEDRMPRGRDSAPFLSKEAENLFFEWAVARQQTGLPVVCQEIVAKGYGELMFD